MIAAEPGEDLEGEADRSRRARNDLVRRHQHLVEFHVRRFPARGALRDDIRQVAFLGLIYAAERFDPGRGVKFSTFADQTIAGELKRFARNQSWAVRPPRSLQETYLEVVAVDGRLTQELGRPPTVAEVASELRCRVDTVLEAIEAGQARRSVSCDVSDRDDDAPWSRAVCNPAVQEAGYERVERAALISRLLDGLPALERAVVDMTVIHCMSQDDAAVALGVSQSFVSRTRRLALARMRRVLDRAS
jgi:RNA polymerase sigma-B factor